MCNLGYSDQGAGILSVHNYNVMFLLHLFLDPGTLLRQIRRKHVSE